METKSEEKKKYLKPAKKSVRDILKDLSPGMDTSEDENKNILNDKAIQLKKTSDWHAINPFHKRTLHQTMIDKASDDFWQKPTHIACWFCGHNFPTPPLPLPEKCSNGKFITSGVYCTFCCVKSQISKQMDFFYNERIENLTTMMNDVYGFHVTAHDVPVIDKEMFEKYGGTISYDEYIKNSACAGRIKLRTVPFVDQPLVLENEDLKDSEITRPKMKSIKKDSSDEKHELKKIEE